MMGLRASIATAVVATCIVASTDARADDPAQARVSGRHAIVEGDLRRARTILSGASSPDAPAAERAAIAELLYIIDLWTPNGRPPAATVANDAPAPDVEEDWQRAFANGRDRLVAGQYAEAARRFDALVASAPDLVAGARAAELRALAREAAPNVQPAAPAAPPPSSSSSGPVAGTPEKPEAKPATESHWYGWQTLLSDGLAIAATPLSPPLGAGLYLLGAPIVHIVHLEGFNVLKSLGVRVIAPIVGGLLGIAASDGCDDGLFCQLEGGAVGVLVGAGIAAVVDAALISWEKVPVEKPADKPVEKKSATIVPILKPGRIGLGGTF